MAAVRHLWFWNSNFLTVGGLRDPFCITVPNLVKIGVAVAAIFQDGGRRHLGFWKIRNFNGLSPVWGQSASSCQISSKSIKQLQRYGDLTVSSQWRPSAILDLSGACWDHPRRLLGGLYRSAKFGWNRCSTFDTMKVLIFCAFGLKTPIHAPKIGTAILVFENFEILTICPL